MSTHPAAVPSTAPAPGPDRRVVVRSLFRGLWAGVFGGALLVVLGGAVLAGLALTGHLDGSFAGADAVAGPDGTGRLALDLRPALAVLALGAGVGAAIGAWVGARRRP